MKRSKNEDFFKVAKAIAFINENFKQQPSLEEIANHLELSPFHFQKIFTKWAGVSPKKFLHYISLDYAKKLLKNKNMSLLETSHELGLSSSSRLHDLFTKIEGMTPGEYKNGGIHLAINYSYQDSLFGKILIASTSKGICYIGFEGSGINGLSLLKKDFPKATYFEKMDSFQKQGLLIFDKDWSQFQEIKLHLKGTEFQLKVWECLLKIPRGNLVTYLDIANSINSPKACRAVGTAIGKNPISFIIPCHRVIRSTGELGGYMWGVDRKVAMIGWEGCLTNGDIDE